MPPAGPGARRDPGRGKSGMVIVMRATCAQEDVARVEEKLRSLGLHVFLASGKAKTVLGVLGDTKGLDPRDFQVMPGVSEAYRVSEPYKLASRSFHPENSVIKVKNVEIGGDRVILMAGPCTVE